MIHSLGQETIQEGACSECGRVIGRRQAFLDPHTRSEVELCPMCAMALMQRQHFSSGCCD